MTTSDRELEADAELRDLTTEFKGTEEEEAILNAQIASIRLKISQVRDRRYGIKQKITSKHKDRESVVRTIELEKQAEATRLELEEKTALAAERLLAAPWYDPTFTKPNTAFKWQVEGAVKLPGRALLADKRGLGKTLSLFIWRRVQGAKRTLICLRKEVASDFMKEIYIREPGLLVWPLIGANTDQRNIAAKLLKDKEEFVVITNIESWRRSIDATTEALLQIPYDAVILDEAHHIKNAGTGTAQGFFRLAQKVPKVLELTGTPIKNRPQEMFSLLHALYPDLFPRESKFLFDYCTQISQNRFVFTQMGLKSLVSKISHFYLARAPEDIGRKVPPPRMIEYKLDFEAHPDQKKAYQDMTQRSLAILNSGKVIPIVSQLAVMTRQAQVVSWPAGIVFNERDLETGEIIDQIRFDVHQSVKADWAEELIKELVEEDERVILFSRFKPAIYELKRRLESLGIPVAVITGDERGANEPIFNDFDLKTAPKNPRFKVLLATYQTVGESANLNAARHMVLYDRFWNPGNEDQAIGRIDRINSIDQATVHIPLVENTIDDYMSLLIDEKRNIVQDFSSAANMQASLTKHLQESV